MTDIVESSQLPGRFRRLWKTLGPIHASLFSVFVAIVLVASIALLLKGRFAHPLFASLLSAIAAYPLMPLVFRHRVSTVARALNVVWICVMAWLLIGRRAVAPPPIWADWLASVVMGLYVGVFFLFWSDLRLYLGRMLSDAEERARRQEASA